MTIELNTNLVLVTGGDGWLGQGMLHALVRGLPDCEQLREPQRGLTIRTLVLPGGEAAVQAISKDIEVVTGDLRNPADCMRLCQQAQGAVVFHLAGMIHPRRVREFYQVNVAGIKNLLTAAVKAGVRRAVIMSSNSPIGCNPHPDHLFDEDSPYNPYMNYGRSKMLMELHVKEIHRSGQIETVIIRAPWFYGPFQPPRQTLFFKMIRDGKGPVVGGGENRRSMAYIDNLVQGSILAAMTPAANGQIYWIADERPYTMNEIIDTVERLLETEFNQKCKHSRLHLPGFVADIAMLCDWAIQSIGFYHQKIHVLSEMNKTIACSIEKARQELSYKPMIALEEGMRRSIQWLLGQKYTI